MPAHPDELHVSGRQHRETDAESTPPDPAGQEAIPRGSRKPELRTYTAILGVADPYFVDSVADLDALLIRLAAAALEPGGKIRIHVSYSFAIFLSSARLSSTPSDAS